MTLKAGTVLKDNLRLVRELGSGAMGTVWVAENLALGSEVAVKVLRHNTQSEEARARFAQEARGVAGIDSPHVVRIFDYGVAESGEPFIVMELLRGEDLHERIERNGALSMGETVTLMRQVCRALGPAHDRGIIHRDIKPANIFLMDNDGEPLVKVLDFGIAKQLDAGELGMTETGAMMGTPYYMSPEQLLDPRNVDARSDVWAIGAMTYACLTASVPFAGETLGALSVAIHTGDFEAPTKRAPGLPGGLDGWMAKALARDPDERFASVREMAAALQLAAQSPSQSAITSGAPPIASDEGVAANDDLPVASTIAMPAAQTNGAAAGDTVANATPEPAKTASADTEVAPNSMTGAEAAPSSLGTQHSAGASTADDSRAESQSASEPGQSSGAGRMLGVAMGAGLLVAGGIFVGTRLSAPQGTSATDSTAASTAADSSAATESSANLLAENAAPSSKTSAETASPKANGSAASPQSGSKAGGSGPSGQGDSALSPSGVLTAAQVRSAMLSCWSRHEGKNPGVKGSAALVILERPHGPAVNSLAMRHPHFSKCAYGALSTLYQRQFEGRFEVKVQLPGASAGPAFPSEAEIRSAALSCWASTEGGQPGAGGWSLSGRVWYGGFSMGTRITHKQFKGCFLSALRSMNKRGDDNTAQTRFSVQLPAKGPVTPMP